MPDQPDPPPPEWEAFRRAMPRQFTRLTKHCARCGARVQYDDTKQAFVCPRCQEEY